MLVGAVLLGAWCAFTLDTRQLDRAQRLVRQASRRDIEAGAEAGNYTFPGLLSRASDCARSLALPQVKRPGMHMDLWLLLWVLPQGACLPREWPLWHPIWCSVG